MTLNLRENTWAKPALIIGFVLLIIGVWAYLAGGIFMIAMGYKFEDATLLTLAQYYSHYRDNSHVEKWLMISSGIALFVLLLPCIWLFAPAKKSLFGDARFASKAEVKKAGLLGEKGIIVGQKYGKYLMFGGQQHAIISAPTRSGKGVGVVIPNLLNWPDSVVVLDVKQENWDITSAFRKKHGQACFLFNPSAADKRSHRYNPLSYISEDKNFRIDDTQKIANMLFPDTPGTDLIWTATPRSLFLGIVLYLIETPDKPVTVGQVLREASIGDGSEHFKKIIAEREKAGNPLSSACVRALNTYISIASENTRSGVISGFRSRLELWQNPLVDAATSGNDFDLRDIRKKRMSIYLGVTPDNLDRMAPLLNLFFQQLIDLNTRELPNQNKEIKYTCLLLMDEFTAIGKIPILSKGISYIAGYWLRMLPIIQSPAQLVEVYGKDAAQTFQTNHALQIIFPPKASETQTAKDISEWLGYQTVKGVSESKSKNIFKRRDTTQSSSDQRRALLLPQEITNLPQGTELVIMENMPPLIANKVTYFNDKSFIDRLKSVSNLLKSIGNKMPSKGDLDRAIESGEMGAFVPLIDVDAFEALNAEFTSNAITSAGSKTETVTVIREVNADDIISKTALELYSQLNFKFAPPKIPENGIFDDAACKAYADDLCRQIGIEPASEELSI